MRGTSPIDWEDRRMSEHCDDVGPSTPPAFLGAVGPDAATGALLRDAATVLTARRCLDGLLTQLAAQPFSCAAYEGLRIYLAGPADRAAAAYLRVCVAMAGR